MAGKGRTRTDGYSLPVGVRISIWVAAISMILGGLYLYFRIENSEPPPDVKAAERIAFTSECTLVTSLSKGLKINDKIQVNGTVLEVGLPSPCGTVAGIRLSDAGGEWFICCAGSAEVGIFVEMYGVYSGTHEDRPWMEVRYMRKI